MKIRLHTLWKIPVFCSVASWISFYVTIYLGRYFFVVKTTGADGVTEVSSDPVRSALFHGALFLIVLLVGGLWAFQSMTKLEIALSAAILSAIYFALTLSQAYLSNLPVSLIIQLAALQNWTSILSSLLYRVTVHFYLFEPLVDLAPFLFVPFGKKTCS